MAVPKWEFVANENMSKTYRLKVIGGWIVMTTYGEGRCSSFVPDLNYEWSLKD